MTYRQVTRILRDNGWKEIRSKGSHHQFTNCDNPGGVVTVPHHGNKDISRGVLKNLEEGTGLSFRR